MTCFLFWHQFGFQLLSYQNRKLWPVAINIWRGHLALGYLRKWSSLAYLLQKKVQHHGSWMRTIKHDAKKAFSVIKMTISICVNRKLQWGRRQNRKTTELQKEQIFSHLYAQALAPQQWIAAKHAKNYVAKWKVLSSILIQHKQILADFIKS